MPYAYATLQQVVDAVSLRLDDPQKRFYTDAELKVYASTALRIWNALTGQQRDRGVISTTAPTAFYALDTSLVGSAAVLLRARTLVDRDLVSEIEYHLMEQQGLSAWAGTAMFNLDMLITALQRRRDQFLGETGVTLSERTYPAAPLIVLEDDVIAIRRAVLIDADNRYFTLSPSDERTTTSFISDLTSPALPVSYSVTSTAPLQLRIMPDPPSGTISLLAAITGPALSTTANGNAGTLLGVPDDLAWGPMFGALADLLLSDNTPNDPMRAEIAEQMYQLAVQTALSIPVILHAEIDGRAVVPEPMRRIDLLRNGWQGTTPTASPDALGVLSVDSIALIPAASGEHSITLDVVRSAVIPSGAEYVQLGREQLDAVTSMIICLAQWKLGGPDTKAAEPLLTAFLSAAQHYSYMRNASANAIQRALGTSTSDFNILPMAREPRDIHDAEDVRSERNARRRKRV